MYSKVSILVAQKKSNQYVKSTRTIILIRLIANGQKSLYVKWGENNGISF